MKFNMGCGMRRMDGYVNVDASPAAAADQVWDLEVLPWPWPDNCAEEIRFIHSLEHMGADTKVYLGIIKEIYRIAAPGCRVRIEVPHPRHDNFLGDPTHVRAITGPSLQLFDRELNDLWRRNNAANTPLGVYLDVDFKMLEDRAIVEPEVYGRMERGEISAADVHAMIRHQYNIAAELHFTLEVRKPPFGAGA